MQLKWITYAMAFVVAVWMVGPAGADANDPPPDLAAARQAFEENLALGDSLGGRPAAQEQVDEAERLYEAAIGGARAYLLTHAREAEPHWLSGMILCGSYRPVKVPKENADDSDQMITTLARGCVSGCEEGLAEFRSALRLDNSNSNCLLDYAEAMLRCDDVTGCHQQCTSIWETKSKLSKPQIARCACLLAGCARSDDRPIEEIRWLKEALQFNSADANSTERLCQLLSEQPGISWLSYEVGRAVAVHANKLMVVHFTTDWCGWCRKLEQETYPNAVVVARLNKCVCVKVNGDRRRDLTLKYDVKGYPTTLVLHPSGHVLRTIVGYWPADAYAAELDKALKFAIE